MKSQKGFVAIIAVILVVVALALVVYLIYQKPTMQTNIPQQSQASVENTQEVTDQYTNWKTYTDTKNGFSFKYPEDWNEYLEEGSIRISGQGVRAERQGMDVNVYENIADMGAKGYLEQILYGGDTTNPLYKLWIKNNTYTPVQVDGIQGTQFDLTQGYGSKGTGVWINKNGTGILLTFHPVVGQKELIQPILSTFRFIAQ